MRSVHERRTKIENKDASLKKHKHTFHEEPKDFKCNSCVKSFTSQDYLKLHNLHHQHFNVRLNEEFKQITLQ